MRGRRPSGTEVVDRLEGSSTAKERFKVVFETMAGQCRVEEACRRLGISEQRFRQLRDEVVAGALAGLEPGKPGRRPKIATDLEEQNRTLQKQLAAKDFELRAAQARAEVALTLPRVVQEPVAEKKTPRRPRQRGRPPGTRKNT